MNSLSGRPLDEIPLRRAKLVLITLLLIATVALLGYRGAARGFQQCSDFGLYYCSAVAFLQTGDSYSPEPLRAIAEHRGVPTNVIENAIAPPLCYVPLLPLALLPWALAKPIWVVVNLICVGLLFLWLRKLSGLEGPSDKIAVLGLAAIVTGLAPLQTNIAFGQLAVVATAGIVGAIYYAGQGRAILAAMLYILAGLLKPQLAIAFAVYWLYCREWKLIGYTAGVGGLIAVLTILWLHWKNPLWFDIWQTNLVRLTNQGRASDFTRTRSFIFADLRVPLYAIFMSKPAATAVAWFITLGLGLTASVRLRSIRTSGTQLAPPDQSRHRLHIAAIVACLGMLPIYHVYYDATIMLIPAAWAIGEWHDRKSKPALATLLLLMSMLIPGQSLLNKLAQQGAPPEWIIQGLLYKAILLPHLSWLILGCMVCLIIALYTQAGYTTKTRDTITSLDP